jgi:hypothetical protein
VAKHAIMMLVISFETKKNFWLALWNYFAQYFEFDL